MNGLSVAIAHCNDAVIFRRFLVNPCHTATASITIFNHEQILSIGYHE